MAALHAVCGFFLALERLCLRIYSFLWGFEAVEEKEAQGRSAEEDGLTGKRQPGG